MGPFFSPKVATEDMYDQFRVFDKGVIPIFNQLPRFLAEKARKTRAFIQQQFQSDDFWMHASPFFQARRQVYLKQFGAGEGSFHKSNVGLLWTSVGNSAPAIFWTLLFLLENSEAWETCKKQVDSVIANRKQQQRGDEEFPLLTLDDLNELTYLQSAFMETLRLYQGNFTARRVVEDFILETEDKNYLIESGCNLMVWWGVMHSGPRLFENPDQFQFDRFVGKSRTDF